MNQNLRIINSIGRVVVKNCGPYSEIRFIYPGITLSPVYILHERLGYETAVELADHIGARLLTTTEATTLFRYVPDALTIGLSQAGLEEQDFWVDDDGNIKLLTPSHIARTADPSKKGLDHCHKIYPLPFIFTRADVPKSKPPKPKFITPKK
jgi:hypothetical protein